MGVQKNASYKVHNGTDFDEINFKTIAAQVFMASGIDLETGFTNLKSENGYLKLPNGFILQYGLLHANSNTNGSNFAGEIVMPIAMPNKTLFSIGELTHVASGSYNASLYTGAVARTENPSRLSYYYNKNMAGGPTTQVVADVFWFAIGY